MYLFAENKDGARGLAWDTGNRIQFLALPQMPDVTRKSHLAFAVYFPI